MGILMGFLFVLMVHVCVPISGPEKSYGWDVEEVIPPVEEVIHTHCILVSAQSQKWDLGLILFGFDKGPLSTWGIGLGLWLDNIAGQSIDY